MALTYVTYAIIGLHTGLWLQAWTWAWAVVWCVHVTVWLGGAGREGGAVGVLDYWLGRPLVAMLAGSIGFLYYRLVGSPVARWSVHVWVDDRLGGGHGGKAGKIGYEAWREQATSVVASWVRAVPPRQAPSHAVRLTDTELWPFHGHLELSAGDVEAGGGEDVNRNYTRLRLGDSVVDGPPPTIVFYDKQEPSGYKWSHFLLSRSPGHQLLHDLALLHSVALALLVTVWERWPTVPVDGSAIGASVLVPGYALATLAAAWVSAGNRRLWPNPWRRRFFWAGWVALSVILLGLGCGLGAVHALHERWTGGAIPLGTTLASLPLLHTICYWASRTLAKPPEAPGAAAPRRRKHLDAAIPYVPYRDLLRPTVTVHH